MFRFSHLAFATALTFSGALAAADHNHDDHGHDDHGHGPTQALGQVEAGTVKLTLASAGAATPGSELHIEIAAEPTTAAFTAIRVWVGIENGRGSEKARAQPEADHAGHWSAHVAVPKALPEGSRLWIQTQVDQGNPVVVNVALPTGQAPAPGKPAHDHAEGDGHNHNH